MLGKNGVGNLMKQAQQMQEKMQRMQDELKQLEATGEAGGGWVKVTLNGDNQLIRIDIKEDAVNDKEMLEDLITAAHNAARIKITTLTQEKSQETMGGFNLPPGMKLPF